MTDFAFALDLDITIVYTLLAALGVIVLDTLLGIVKAFAAGEFDWRQLPKFMQSALLPYVGSLVILSVFAFFMPAIKTLLYAAAAAVGGKFMVEIKDKLVDMALLRDERATD